MLFIPLVLSAKFMTHASQLESHKIATVWSTYNSNGLKYKAFESY